MHVPGGSDELRKQREIEFHDHRYTSEARTKKVSKYYLVQRRCREDYARTIRASSQGKYVLEFGCGEGNDTAVIAHLARHVTAIDLSSVAIEHAKAKAQEENVTDRITFKVMDGEHLEFEDETFDLVCGSAVLHHLDCHVAFREIHRVLKPHGRAIFVEPLGENPVINAFRRLTPEYRSVDEHPLVPSEIALAEKYFADVSFTAYTLTALAAVPLRNTPLFSPILAALDGVDSLLFRVPGLKYMAWYALLDFRNTR